VAVAAEEPPKRGKRRKVGVLMPGADARHLRFDELQSHRDRCPARGAG
jgi:hypothetical protein